MIKTEELNEKKVSFKIYSRNGEFQEFGIHELNENQKDTFYLNKATLLEGVLKDSTEMIIRKSDINYKISL
jgi:hypothetical protein